MFSQLQLQRRKVPSSCILYRNVFTYNQCGCSFGHTLKVNVKIKNGKFSTFHEILASNAAYYSRIK